MFKVKLAAIARNEAFYIASWVHHHFYFGFDEIEIWINHTNDNSLKILNKLKEYYGNKLIYKTVDDIFNYCRKNKKFPQVYAYESIYRESLLSDFTHLIFLDLDEYWISRDFSKSIKDCIAKFEKADVICFQWYLDAPNKNKKINSFYFSDIENDSLKLQKNRHLKSLLNIKTQCKVEKIDIHNHYVKDGLYILANECTLTFESADTQRAWVPQIIFSDSRTVLDEYFIFHQVYRSSVEYEASLLKGNNQTREGGILKSNRSGYIPVVAREYMINWNISGYRAYFTYKNSYFDLFKLIKNECEKSKNFVLKSANKVR